MMRNQGPGRHLRAGLGIVEMLIALAITAMLLTSVAIALHASTATYDVNQRIAAATHHARMTLHRMLADARQADDLQWDGSTAVIRQLCADGLHETQYQWDGENLRYRKYIAGTQLTGSDGDIVVGGVDQVRVVAFNVTPVPGVDAAGQAVACKRLTASITLELGNDRFVVNASTAPRRNQDW